MQYYAIYVDDTFWVIAKNKIKMLYIVHLSSRSEQCTKFFGNLIFTNVGYIHMNKDVHIKTGVDRIHVGVTVMVTLWARPTFILKSIRWKYKLIYNTDLYIQNLPHILNSVLNKKFSETFIFF